MKLVGRLFGPAYGVATAREARVSGHPQAADSMSQQGFTLLAAVTADAGNQHGTLQEQVRVTPDGCSSLNISLNWDF
jgi:hypothetical protein